MASDQSQQRIGLIILGNSGVGKSFIGNLFLRNEKFVHRSKPTAVTTQTESEEYTIGSTTYVIFNIPGLVEADDKKSERNKKEIHQAFLQCPNSVVLYVFGPINGRLRQEDFITFNALNEAYPFGSESLIVVINTIPTVADRDPDYEGETITCLRQYMDNIALKHICFLDQIDKANEAEKRKLFDKLLPVVLCSVPKVHEKIKDISLAADEIKKLTEKCKDITKRYAEEKGKMQKEFHEAQKEHEIKMEAERNELKKQLEKQKEEFEKQQEKQQQEFVAQLRKEQKIQRDEFEKQLAQKQTQPQHSNEIDALRTEFARMLQEHQEKADKKLKKKLKKQRRKFEKKMKAQQREYEEDSEEGSEEDY
ncbi:unnamed protein product [Adineta steineri]|uniref:AIG1-type G domain-containing protein n=1 Tax=Adineta steineri TaxID=433720 RepID=A0A815JBQ4_9BILA|nr:unnamed protein product [Adineta steineri]CAF4070053.1 unnamed protein product [Adineta steineri]